MRKWQPCNWNQDNHYRSENTGILINIRRLSVVERSSISFYFTFCCAFGWENPIRKSIDGNETIDAKDIGKEDSVGCEYRRNGKLVITV